MSPSAVWWFGRSANYNNNNNFTNTNTDGSRNNNNANNSSALVAGFYDDTGSNGVAGRIYPPR